MPLADSKYTSNVVLLAQDKTKAAFNSAARGADDLQRRYSGVKLAAGLSAAAVAGLTVALGVATKRSLDHGDAIAKTADAVGLSTAALQEYQHAADLSGVATEQFNKGAEQFAKRMGEARAGTGSLVEFLNKYDSSMVDALQSTTSTEQALDLVFETMGKMTDQTDRAALAAAAFGRSGVALTNIVRNGTKGLEDMRREAQDLGLVLSDSMTRQAERTNDALTRMSKVAGVNVDRVLIALGPLIEAVADGFARAGPKIEAAANALAKFIGGVDLLSFQALEAELAEVNKQLKEFDDAIAADKSKEGFMAQGLEADIERLTAERRHLEILMQTRAASISQHRQLLDDLADTANSGSKATVDAAKKLHDQLVGEAAEIGLTEQQLLEQHYDRQLAAITFSAMTEQQRQEARIAATAIFNDKMADLEMTAAERREAAVAEHLDRIREMEARHQVATSALWESGWQGKMSITSGILGQLAALQGSQSKAMFEVGKAAAIGETVINTYRSATAAYAALAGIPIVGPALGAAAAAAAIAAGIANVQAIRAQQFGAAATVSGTPTGAVSAPPGGAAGDAAAIGPADAGRSTAPRTIIINVESESGIFTDDWLRNDFIPRIQEALDDGTDLRVA